MRVFRLTIEHAGFDKPIDFGKYYEATDYIYAVWPAIGVDKKVTFSIERVEVPDNE